LVPFRLLVGSHSQGQFFIMCEECGGGVCQCPMEPLPNQVPESTGTSGRVVASESLPNERESEAWRLELAARLNRYRSRHKPPPPRYPSLRLPFGPAAPALKTAPTEEDIHSFEPAAEHGFGLDGTESESPPAPIEERPVQADSQLVAKRPAPQASAKIIEFPRFNWAPPPPPPDQLAEPVIDRPRILEVPEFAPPAPALGGITIEAARVVEPEKRPGVDVPLHSAPLGRRLLASAIDGLIVGAASALFGFIFWKIALMSPPRMQLLSLATGVPCLFWVVYQYLLIVYAGSTPGLRLARLQLSRFDGTPTKRSLRRWRVLASYLSAASLGMGYAWVFLDEDDLCWHDRITHTYMARRKRESDS
jgi:uncharacterized RDD family membrane protein YckC